MFTCIGYPTASAPPTIVSGLPPTMVQRPGLQQTGPPPGHPAALTPGAPAPAVGPPPGHTPAPQPHVNPAFFPPSSQATTAAAPSSSASGFVSLRPVIAYPALFSLLNNFSVNLKCIYISHSFICRVHKEAKLFVKLQHCSIYCIS